MRLFAFATVVLGLAGCVSLPSVSKDNMVGVKGGNSLPALTHHTSTLQGMSGDTHGASLEGGSSVPSSANLTSP